MHSLLRILLCLVCSNPFWRNIFISCWVHNTHFECNLKLQNANISLPMYFDNYFMGELAMYSGQQPSTNCCPKYISDYTIRQLPKYIGKVICIWGFKLHLKWVLWTHSRMACNQECRNSPLENISTHFAMHHISNCGWVCRYCNRKFRRNYAATHSS